MKKLIGVDKNLKLLLQTLGLENVVGTLRTLVQQQPHAVIDLSAKVTFLKSEMRDTLLKVLYTFQLALGLSLMVLEHFLVLQDQAMLNIDLQHYKLVIVS